MMRDGIEFSGVVSLIQSLPPEVKVEEKKAWVKVEGPDGRRIYVSKRDIVREVHLSGWGKGLPGTVPPPRDNGRVQAHLDMTQEEPLERLRELFGDLSRPTEEASSSLSSPSSSIEVTEETRPGSRSARGLAMQPAGAGAIKPMPSRRLRATEVPGDKQTELTREEPAPETKPPRRPARETQSPGAAHGKGEAGGHQAQTRRR